jgi:hypothetical protein
MLRLAASTVAAALVLAAALAAQEGAAEKKETGKKKHGATRPVGTWTRGEGGTKVVFEIKKHSLRFRFNEGGKSLTADADYGVTKDGVLFGRISKIEKNGLDNAPPAGTLFSFRFALKDGTLTISELQPGEGDARQAVEGEYKGGPAKKKNKD